LVDDSYNVKVTDFGYCTATKEGHAWNFTGHNLIDTANKGTPAYMVRHPTFAKGNFSHFRISIIRHQNVSKMNLIAREVMYLALEW